MEIRQRAQKEKGIEPCGLQSLDLLVARLRIELRTRGFSVHCSTD